MATMTFEKLLKSAEGNVFPSDKIKGCHSALVLFAAAFLGRQDAVWLAAEGIKGTCIDLDQEKLDVMRRVYPKGWKFLCADVYEFVSLTDNTYDVVTIDCPTNHFEKVAEMPNLWTMLANKIVVLGSNDKTHKEIKAPGGWRKLRPVYRSPIANWTVLRAR